MERLDLMVKACLFANRSQAIQAAVAEKVSRVGKTRLARECAKLDPAEEQALAEEGILADAELWPPY